MRFSLLAVLLCMAAPLAAQPAFGLRAGLNVTTIVPDSDSDLTDRSAKLGFTGGLFAEVPVASGVALQPELLYSQKGVNRDDDGNADIGVDYLEIPVLVKAALPVSDLLDLDVYAGPSLAVKLGDDDEVDTVRFNSTNLGGAVGIGLASGPFGVDARYTFSLQDATEGEANDLRHRVVSLTGVYRFGR
ncbi:MAG: porin family protein [Bacteroidota bacterium]